MTKSELSFICVVENEPASSLERLDSCKTSWTSGLLRDEVRAFKVQALRGHPSKRQVVPEEVLGQKASSSRREYQTRKQQHAFEIWPFHEVATHSIYRIFEVSLFCAFLVFGAPKIHCGRESRRDRMHHVK